MKKILLYCSCLLYCALVMAQKYDEQGESRYGYTPVKQGNYWGIIDSTDRLITPIQYQTAQIINLNCNQAALLLDDLWAYHSTSS